MWRWLVRAVALLFCLALLAGLGVVLWLRTSLPQTNGQIAMTGITAPVEILRDDAGIVTIRAASEADGYFALGFAHAQDRLFQMEFMRRYGAGRLSEVIGPSTVELDKRMRVFGLHAAARANLSELPDEVVTALDAYAAGVNAFLATRDGALPLEFQMLNHEPEPWKPEDSLLWGRLMALQLSDNWRAELFRYRLSLKLPPDRLETLWPAHPDGADTAAVLDPAAPTRLAAPALAFPEISGASNSWAVAGSRTASGKPLLANDPHLGLTVPNQWYLARIETPAGVVAGATAPGVPFMVIGHNGRVAWTYTTTHSDTEDLFVEKLVDGDPTRYVTPGGDSLFMVREEVIKVRGEADVTFVVRQSAHGPIVSDIGMGVEAAVAPDSVVALAWPGFREDDRTAAALYRMGKARNAGELREALRLFDSPQQNVVFADVDGAIGFTAAGRVPVRKALSAGSQMPAPGWSGAYDWTGFLPFEELPQSFDPEDGIIVTANNDITPPGYPHFIAARWEEPFRARRIEEMLDGRSGLTAVDMGRMQMDDLSLAARDILPGLLAQLRDTELEGNTAIAAEILLAWDYRMDRDAAAPLIFAAWLRELDARVFGPELGELYQEFALWNGNGAGTLAGFQGSAEDWCGRAAAAARQGCRTAFAPALEAAVAALSAAYGDDPAAWRWGDTHRARFAHPLLDRLPLIGELFATEVGTDGDNFTVNRGTALPGPGMSFPHVHGASLRVVFDLADLDRSLFMLPTGQSGNPLSANFDDLVTRWRDGGFLTIVGGADAGGLTLVPAGR